MKKLLAYKNIFLKTICLLGLPLLSWYFIVNFEIAFNSSDSFPYWVFLIHKNNKNIQINDLVEFKSPKNSKISQKYYFIKKIIGVPGDFVENISQKLYINQDLFGEIKLSSPNGTKLLPINSQKIEKNYYFMWSPHMDSYDSRYQNIGLIHKNEIIGKAYPLSVQFWWQRCRSV